MSQVLIIDTVAAIAILNEQLDLDDTVLIKLPIIVLGELYAGARNSARVDSNLQKIAIFVKRSTVLYCDDETAGQYGIVIAQLRKKGRPSPQNDAWIAALAL